MSSLDMPCRSSSVKSVFCPLTALSYGCAILRRNCYKTVASLFVLWTKLDGSWLVKQNLEKHGRLEKHPWTTTTTTTTLKLFSQARWDRLDMKPNRRKKPKEGN
jgi:hypothetical protein